MTHGVYGCFSTSPPTAADNASHGQLWTPPVFGEPDPIFNAIPDARARERLISRFDLELTEPEWALGYRFDIVLRGRDSTPFERRT